MEIYKRIVVFIWNLKSIEGGNVSRTNSPSAWLFLVYWIPLFQLWTIVKLVRIMEIHKQILVFTWNLEWRECGNFLLHSPSAGLCACLLILALWHVSKFRSLCGSLTLDAGRCSGYVHVTWISLTESEQTWHCNAKTTHYIKHWSRIILITWGYSTRACLLGVAARATLRSQSLATVFIIFFMFPSPCPFPVFSAANLALAGFPLTNALGENLPPRH